MALLFVVAALVLLHAVLLWQRVDDRSIARPEVAMRWIVAAVIAGAALLVRRVSTGSRIWIVFWLTVALPRDALYARPRPNRGPRRGVHDAHTRKHSSDRPARSFHRAI